MQRTGGTHANCGRNMDSRCTGNRVYRRPHCHYLPDSAIQRAIQSDTHSKLYTHYLEVTKLLLQKPQLRPYFYGGKVLDKSVPDQADIRQEIEVMCEVFLSLFEHAVVQKNNLPGDSWQNCWRAYVKSATRITRYS